MTDGNTDFAGMSDADLDAALGALDADDVADDTATDTTTDDQGDTDADPPANGQQSDDASTEPNTEADTDAAEGDKGPGDLKVALKQERERRQQLAAQLEQERQFRAQVEAQQAQARAEQDEAQYLANLQSRLEQSFDPAEQAQIAAEMGRVREQAVAKQFQAELAQREYTRGIELAREAFTDFDAVMTPAMQDATFRAALEAVGQTALANGQNPVIAAYKHAKQFSPAAIEARIKAEREAAVKEFLAKQKPPTTQGHATIGHVASQSAAKPLAKDPRDMTDDELEALTK